MDLNTITEVVRRPQDPPGSQWRDGDAWLAGGTWLFSDQQPDLRRLIDLAPLGWDGVLAGDSGLDIGATTTIHDLYAFGAPVDWTAADLFAVSCEAFLASFKVWNAATVGGNICMSLPAGPMITLTVSRPEAACAGQLPNWGETFAGATIATVPLILLFLLLQRYFVRGMAMSGLKG